MNTPTEPTELWGMVLLAGERTPRAALVTERALAERRLLAIQHIVEGRLGNVTLVPIERLQSLEVLGQSAALAAGRPGMNTSEVIAHVATLTGVAQHRILGRERVQEVVVARFLVMHGCRRLGLTLTATGALLGRDHGAVDSGLKKLSLLAHQVPQVKAWNDELDRRWNLAQLNPAEVKAV